MRRALSTDIVSIAASLETTETVATVKEDLGNLAGVPISQVRPYHCSNDMISSVVDTNSDGLMDTYLNELSRQQKLTVSSSLRSRRSKRTNFFQKVSVVA